MRTFGVDVHRRFLEVSVSEGGRTGRIGRVEMADLETFADSLAPDDHVVIESTSVSWAVVDVLGRRAGRVTVSNPNTLPNRPCGRWIAHPLRRHADAPLPADLVEILTWYATCDPDPPEISEDFSGDISDEHRSPCRSSSCSSGRPSRRLRADSSFRDSDHCPTLALRVWKARAPLPSVA